LAKKKKREDFYSPGVKPQMSKGGETPSEVGRGVNQNQHHRCGVGGLYKRKMDGYKQGKNFFVSHVGCFFYLFFLWGGKRRANAPKKKKNKQAKNPPKGKTRKKTKKTNKHFPTG